ncbi:MAG: ChbG/HpnK family deacetylase [Alphaproteobacteria bacterium]
MKNILIHADDFGLSPGVNEAIIELGQKKRLSGTAVMSIFTESQYKADILSQIKDFSIGLHITLTDQILCHKSSLTDNNGKAYSLKEVIQKSQKNQLNSHDLEQEITTQIEHFHHIFNRYPDYFDGHHHVQLLKPVRQALHQITTRLNIPVYIRNAYMPLSFGLSPKKMVLRYLNRGMQADIQRWGWQTNSYFAGSYGSKPIAQYFKHILSLQKDNLLMMVHPGFVDEILQSRDKMQEARKIEYDFLASDGFTQLLKKYNYHVA